MSRQLCPLCGRDLADRAVDERRHAENVRRLLLGAVGVVLW